MEWKNSTCASCWRRLLTFPTPIMSPSSWHMRATRQLNWNAKFYDHGPRHETHISAVAIFFSFFKLIIKLKIGSKKLQNHKRILKRSISCHLAHVCLFLDWTNSRIFIKQQPQHPLHFRACQLAPKKLSAAEAASWGERLEWITFKVRPLESWT